MTDPGDMAAPAAPRADPIDEALTQWERERPDLDMTDMSVFAHLVAVGRLWAAQVERVIARHGLKGGEFDALAALRRSGAPHTLIPSELAQMLMMSRAGMTSRLDRLEAAGLISRELDPDDRRSFRVALTERGREAIDAAVVDHLAALTPLRTALSDRQRRSLDQALRELLGEVSRSSP